MPLSNTLKKISLLCLLATAVHGQDFQHEAVPAVRHSSRWEIGFTGALSAAEHAGNQYARSRLHLRYTTPALQLGATGFFNHSQEFAFLPPRLIIQVDDADIEFSGETRFTARPERYVIDQPAALFARFRHKNLTVRASFAAVTQETEREIASPQVVGDSLFFINWQPAQAKKSEIVSALAAGLQWRFLHVQAGAANLALLTSGDGDFKYAYRLQATPFFALTAHYKAARLTTVADQKSFAMAYHQSDIPAIFSAPKTLTAQLRYRSGIDDFSFHALAAEIALPVTNALTFSAGLEASWSAQKVHSVAAFERWQHSLVFGDTTPLADRLSQRSVFFGLNFAIDAKPPAWPLRFVQSKLLQKRIFRAKHSFYSTNPIGTVELYNNAKKSVRAQLVIETTDGAGRYRSESFAIAPGEIKSQPFYLYLQDIDNGTLESFEQLTISTIIENEKRVMTNLPVIIYGKNAWSGDTWELKYFVAPDDPVVKQRAKQIYLQSLAAGGAHTSAQAKFRHLRAFLDALGTGATYIPDPTSTLTVDQVQYPVETLAKGGGDCEDLVVFLASSLMAVGIQAAVVDVRPKLANEVSVPTAEPGSIGHVFLLVDTGIAAENWQQLGLSEFQGVTRKNAKGRNTIWIPFETAEAANGFDSAFREGVRQYYREIIENDGVSKGLVHVYDF